MQLIGDRGSTVILYIVIYTYVYILLYTTRVRSTSVVVEPTRKYLFASIDDGTFTSSLMDATWSNKVGLFV